MWNYIFFKPWWKNKSHHRMLCFAVVFHSSQNVLGCRQTQTCIESGFMKRSKKLYIVAWTLPLAFTFQPGHSVGMLAAVEHGPILCSDSNILCLSWKGRVPKSEKDKPVCRRRYYEEGWLATGNGRGVVGVTFTSSHCRRDRTTPQRINFNLRGHNSEVWSWL